MPTPNQIKNQINSLITFLVKIGLVDDQHFAFQRTGKVTFDKAEHVSNALKNLPYEEIYDVLVRARAYNVKMLDGALIQMMYEFVGRTLLRHRLAFFPAPHLEEFQNNTSIYLDDEIYADIIDKNIVPFPVRFDFDSQDIPDQEPAHPKSHLTLGQYKHCRIPVTAPVMPARFIDFILRNFYHTKSVRYADQLPVQNGSFAESIRLVERNLVHIVTPT